MARRHMGIEPLCISVEECADSLGLSRQTVYTLMETEGLPSVHFGRARKVPMEQLRAWLNERVAAEREQREDQARQRDPLKFRKSV